ncbi:MAG: T9SS type A sorting domain-containing protein [candidate division WOR-3 bacterium]
MSLVTAPILSYDVDRDGLPEILSCKQNETPQGYEVLTIYESIGNNNYIRIFSQIYTNTSLTSTIAFGDFDRDSLIEFVVCGTRMYIYESPANNTYEKIYEAQLFPPFIPDCFSTMDLDRDGKLEFIVKSIYTYAGYVRSFIFEAPSNNTYEIIKDFTFYSISNFEYAGGFSDSGDIDGDSIPEIILEASDTVAIIKAYSDENGYYNDSFYVWQTLPGNATGSSVRVYDLDRNGLNEIIISGNNHTRIYEKTPFVTWFCPVQYDTFWANDTVYPRWRFDETIALDSLRLYWSRPQMGCHLIYQGLPTDTICQWVVPDTPSNFSNRFWLVVKGNGRYDSTSPPVFYIKRHTGVEETKISQSTIQNPKLEVSPNPFKNHCIIKFQISDNFAIRNPKSEISLRIYDISGRVVKSFNPASIIPNQVSGIFWNGDDDLSRKLPAGVYLLRLEIGDYRKIKKIAFLKKE